MGFAIKDTVAPSLTEEQRYHLPGQCIDINLLSWLIRAASSQRPDSSVTPPVAPVNKPPRLTTRQFAPGAFIPADHYPLTQPPALLDSLPTITSPSPTSTTPFPPPISPWKPLWLPTEWIYIDGSKIDPNPKLGTPVIHPASSAEILIDATGVDETNTILRAKLVAIHHSLTVFRLKPLLQIIATDSLTSLHIISTLLINPADRPHSSHQTLLDAIIALLQARDGEGHHTTLKKPRSHTNIQGNDQADTSYC